MKYKDPITGELRDVIIKSGDTLPIGTVVEFDGDTIPDGYEEFETEDYGSLGNIIVDDVICKNLCSGISQGYFLTANGTSFGRTSTDNGLVIKVKENTDYTISTTDTQARYRIAFTNTLLSVGGSSSDVYNALTKDNTKDSITRNSGNYKYLIVNATDLSKIQVEEGNKATDYASHKKFGYNSTDSMGEIVVDDISCKNLFDKNDAITGYRLGSDGALFADSNYFCSGFITVKPNIQYTANWAMETRECVCYYDESYNFIERNESIKTFTTPSNCHHVRMTGLTSDINNRQLEKGSVSTDYVEHKDFDCTGIKGNVLWTNPNTTAVFPAQTINLNNENWDVAKIYYKNANGEIFSQEILKTYSNSILEDTQFYYDNTNGNGIVNRSRYIRNITGSTIRFTVCNTISVYASKSTYIENNNEMIPLLIIGYKTNLI